VLLINHFHVSNVLVIIKCPVYLTLYNDQTSKGACPFGRRDTDTLMRLPVRKSVMVALHSQRQRVSNDQKALAFAGFSDICGHGHFPFAALSSAPSHQRNRQRHPVMKRVSSPEQNSSKSAEAAI
jgi:hypothetical protein